MARLNPRQQRFCEEYLCDLNATQAAVRAGYSARTANQQGPRLLVNVGVQEEIARLQEQRQQRTEITADWVVGRLRTEATTQGEGASPSARVRALELLGKHVGMWKDETGGPPAPPVSIVNVIRLTAPAPTNGHASPANPHP